MMNIKPENHQNILWTLMVPKLVETNSTWLQFQNVATATNKLVPLKPTVFLCNHHWNRTILKLSYILIWFKEKNQSRTFWSLVCSQDNFSSGCFTGLAYICLLLVWKRLPFLADGKELRPRWMVMWGKGSTLWLFLELGRSGKPKTIASLCFLWLCPCTRGSSLAC